MAQTIDRWQRRALLALLQRQSPEALTARGTRRLAAVVDRAANRSRAYRELFAEAGVDPALRSYPQLLEQLPILQKADIFERFSLEELIADDVSVGDLAGILTSSGHGGSNFAFGVSTWRDKRRTPFDIDLGLEHAFATDQRSTLLVNCLPMGVVFDSRSVCVANVSVREDMACAILNQAGPRFEQCILVLDPLFAKRLVDYATDMALDWAALRPHVILGEEPFSEEFRSYLAAVLGVSVEAPDELRVGSSMGVGELGLNLFFETPATVALRRSLHRADPNAVQPTFFCYNPLRSLVEIVNAEAGGAGDLVVTMLDEHAPIPMIRYRTGDRVRPVDASDLAALTPEQRQALAAQPFPVIAHLGKQTAGDAERWSVDLCKALLYRDAGAARDLSGAFVLYREDAVARWEVQRAPAARSPTDVLTNRLRALVDEVPDPLHADAPKVRVWAYEAFPWGMGLDHERKFRYRQDSP